MSIPKRTHYNYINTEALSSYLEDTHHLTEDVINEILDFISDSIETSIENERAVWLGYLLRQSKKG